MGDVGDDWRAYREDQKERKALRDYKFRTETKQILIDTLNDNGFALQVLRDYPDPEHWLVSGVDYYPTTGTWICKKTKKRGIGIKSLLKWLIKKEGVK